jgi:hypothetical protein
LVAPETVTVDYEKNYLIAPLLLLAASIAWGRNLTVNREKISADLTKRPLSSALDVIVQYRHSPVSRNYAHAANIGATTNRKMHLINAAAFHVPASALARLAADPDVLYVPHPTNVTTLLQATTPGFIPGPTRTHLPPEMFKPDSESL